jgi:hypothetical protein
MSNIDCCADALSGFQILADRIQRGIFIARIIIGVANTGGSIES